ncbi:MAG: RNA methyltransferase [Bacteroidetes bacterium]|nr:RNA methyltransferase [Bacteroidota bacterium]
MRSLVRDARLRYERKAFVIEGPHLVERALEESPKQIESAYFTRDAFDKHLALVSLLEKNRIELHSVTPRQAEQISDTRTPQGIFALVRMPKVKPSVASGVILLDGVQDPGNVGTIIRAAAWFGIGRVILAHGSADPYAPKTVRATQGEIFSVACELTDSVGDTLARLKKEGHKVFTTTLSPDACSLYSEEFIDKFVIVLGSEAHGASPEALAQADRQIMIPRIGSGESLNVAMSAAIILSENAARKLRHT